jgi:hypothetical protein
VSKRGRPKGSKNKQKQSRSLNNNGIDQQSVQVAKRGRPKDSKNKPKTNIKYEHNSAKIKRTRSKLSKYCTVQEKVFYIIALLDKKVKINNTFISSKLFTKTV